MRSSFIALIALAACSRASSQPPSPSASPSPTAGITAGKQLQPATELGSLAARLRYEASHRPATGPKAEQVLGAIDAAGLRVGSPHQYLGLAVHARYCAGGTTPDGLAVSVCEYATPAEALAGKAYADSQFAAMTGAERATHGSALLTVVGPTTERERALHVFETL